MKYPRTTTSLSTLLTLFVAVAGAAAPTWAADPSPPPAAATPADKLVLAREHIAAKRWPQALAELRRVNASGVADWHNLMGYTLRKQSPPNLAEARVCYQAALKMDPSHRGALEYDGELALMTGDLARAELHLATLQRVCTGGCEELADLRREIDRYKANGNRFVASP